MKLTNLRVNNIEKPIGFELSNLSFSWIVGDAKEAKKQKYAQIIVKKDSEIIFDSGKDISANSLDYAVSLELEPRTRYNFSVMVEADNGETAFADSFFETGKINEAWQANWIVPKFPENNKSILPIIEKEFELDQRVEESRIYICGLGVYELYINDEKVSDEFLAPGYHSYDFHLQTQTYDAAKYLKEGTNKLRVILGDGWFKGRFGFDGGYKNIYGDNYYLIAELHIALANGDKQLLVTDDSWKCRRSSIIQSSIYDGEIYDARVNESAVFDVEIKSPKGCGKLKERYSLPIVKKEQFKPIELIHTAKDEYVLDFGQNLTGWVEFECDLPIDSKIKLTASEIMQNGCFYNENFRTAKAEYIYISNGEKAHVRPYFTFYGFRYMKVECDGKVSKDNFTAYHLRSDFEQTGFIHTGNKLVNKLFSNALWSQKDNFLDVPTDCPQRDERMGWTGDAQVFSDTACLNMYMPAFYRKYLWDMRAEQSILNGSVPNVVPRLKQGMVSEHGACPWADAGVIIPWHTYLHYGSKSLLRETYPGMKAWIDCQRKREEKLGGGHLIKDGFHFGDWLALDNEKPGPFGKTDPLFIASAYYYKCTSIVEQAAAILGYEEAKTYGELAKQILKSIRERYYDEKGLCICNTQTALALTIEFELSPLDLAAEGERLDKLISDNNGYLNTGFVGTPILCKALAKTGNDKTAVDLLLNEDYPGWLYCVKLDATTIWERWNSVMPDKSMSPEGMNSLNHYSYGSIVAWLYRYVCGINEKEAGFKTATICPRPDKRLGFAKAELNTSIGRYVSGWKYDKEGVVVYEIEVPFNASAVLELKDETHILRSGKYTFRVKE